MCNLYSITRSQEAMRRLFGIEHDLTGNLPPLADVFPDRLAPIVRVADGERQLQRMRWGMPGPPQFGGALVTNIRNTSSPHWRRWLGPESRCLVPVNSFCEWADTKPKKTPTWFALDDSRPLIAFAGIWTPWHGLRGTKANPIEGWHDLYGFLTTTANGVVGPVHPKAMPVLLSTPEEWDAWLRGPWSEASTLQRPLPNEMMRIVATGAKEDRHDAAVAARKGPGHDRTLLLHAPAAASDIGHIIHVVVSSIAAGTPAGLKSTKKLDAEMLFHKAAYPGCLLPFLRDDGGDDGCSPLTVKIDGFKRCAARRSKEYQKTYSHRMLASSDQLTDHRCYV